MLVVVRVEAVVAEVDHNIDNGCLFCHINTSWAFYHKVHRDNHGQCHPDCAQQQ